MVNSGFEPRYDWLYGLYTNPLSIHALDPGLENFSLAILNTDSILKYAEEHFKSKAKKAGTHKKLPKKNSILLHELILNEYW